jgi:threonine/homoserine/homoserine lactone efflux protein
MESSAWISIAAVCFTGAAVPGPSLAVVIKNTVSGGRMQGVMTGVGHGIGVGIYAFGAVVGVSALVASAPGVSRGIEIVGGLYLLWMGFQVLRHAGQSTDEHSGKGGRAGFVEGFTVAFLNPKIAVFFLALLGSFLPVDATTLERAGVAGLAMVIDVAWYVFAALLLATTGAAAWLATQGLWVDRLFGLLLIGIAAFLIMAG